MSILHFLQRFSLQDSSFSDLDGLGGVCFKVRDLFFSNAILLKSCNLSRKPSIAFKSFLGEFKLLIGAKDSPMLLLC